MDSFDSATYTSLCAGCGNEDFKRTRQHEEVEYLDLDDDSGDVGVHSDDMNCTGEWVYECNHCGNTASDLDDLLTEREDEDDEEDFDPYDHGSLTIGERNPSLATRRF